MFRSESQEGYFDNFVDNLKEFNPRREKIQRKRETPDALVRNTD